MNWFSNISTRAKLLASFGLVVGLLMVVIATFHTSIITIQQTQKQLYERDVANAVGLPQLRADQNGIRADLLTMMLLTDRAERAVWERDLRERVNKSSAVLDDLLKRNQGDAKILGQLQEFASLRADFAKVRDTQIIPLIHTGKIAEAKVLSLGAQSDRYEKMRAIALTLEKEATTATTVGMKRSDERARFAIQMSLGSGAVAVLLAVLLALFLNHVIANPLREISGAAEKIAVGDLSADITANQRRDEVGTLAQTFARMTRSLQGMASVAEQMARGDLRVQVKPQSDKDVLGHAFAAMTVNLQQVIGDISEAVQVLSASATEISASTTQLAASATETASAVTETTATVEEIRQTAQVANEKAKYVSESAQNVARISQDGRRSTEETGQGMQRIREQMDSIGESMMRLSEQSQAIGAIIATVDDLSQQSNLLAVNAAIQAAMAGEQGKGFAVVAQEVKSLADQSKQATMQVRTILSDIQKATSAAVMATEQGSKAVEIGVQQSAQAGESIQTLADNVNTAAQSAMQIAASSQQQLVGMDQMTLAMESIKQASLQNVDGARGLEEASRNLNELGQRLKELVGRYQV